MRAEPRQDLERVRQLAARFTGIVDIERTARIEIVRKIDGHIDRLAASLEARESDVLITREHAIACARNVGRHQGYAIALHGSCIRDLDLIAVPWIEPCAITPLMLAEIIADSLPGVIVGKPEKKPHGRIGFTIYPKWRYGFDTWYIDLSVMPRRRTRSESPSGAVATPKSSGGGR